MNLETAKGRLSLCIFALLALGVFMIPQWAFQRSQAPYEGWDEITIFNNAGALMEGREPERSYAVYGMADTAKYVLARKIYEHAHGKLEPVFSNNIPESWEQPNFDAGKIFGYARGVPDRLPFLIARRINLIFSYSLAAFTAVCAIWILGWRGLAPLFALLVLLSGAASIQQGALALPNQANAVIAFAILVFSALSLIKHQLRWLVVASALLALGINHKFDFTAVGIVTATIACYFVFSTGKRPLRALGVIALLGGVFALSLLLTNPVSLVTDFKFQIYSFTRLTERPPVLSENWAKALFSFKQEFALDTTARESRAWMPFAMVSILAISAFVLPWFAEGLALPKKITLGLCALLSACVCLAFPILKGSAFYGRYLNNGLSISIACAGMGIAVTSLLSRRRWVLLTANLLFISIITIAGLRAYYLWNFRYERQDAFRGMSPQPARNYAVQVAANLAPTTPYSGTVLVDQHAYIDLAFLRRKGIKVVPINMANFETVEKRLPKGCYPVLFTVGDHSSPSSWEGQWSEQNKSRYNRYLERLQKLPVIKDFPGPKMQLLGWRPPQADDWITVSSLVIHQEQLPSLQSP